MFEKNKLLGKKIALLSTDGFEQSELLEPLAALQKAGADVQVVSINKGQIKGWQKGNWGKFVDVDLTLDEAEPEDFDALMLPGGVMNPDKLRLETKAVKFAAEFMKAGKPIAAICHGPQLLIETGALDGRKMTSFPSLKSDFKNAGAIWLDEEVVVDQGLVTSRKPADIPAFNKKMIEVFAEGLYPVSRQRTTRHRAEKSRLI